MSVEKIERYFDQVGDSLKNSSSKSSKCLTDEDIVSAVKATQKDKVVAKKLIEHLNSCNNCFTLVIMVFNTVELEQLNHIAIQTKKINISLLMFGLVARESGTSIGMYRNYGIQKKHNNINFRISVAMHNGEKVIKIAAFDQYSQPLQQLPLRVVDTKNAASDIKYTNASGAATFETDENKVLTLEIMKKGI